MGARISHTDTTINAIPFKIDRLGHAYCGHCIGFGHGGETQHAEKHSHIEWIERCDGCWRTPTQFPVVEVKATATIEHTPCKVF